jgi:hypothetical protein
VPYTGRHRGGDGIRQDRSRCLGPHRGCRGARRDGSASVSGTEIRSALALPDDRVWINADKNVVGAIRSKYDD